MKFWVKTSITKESHSRYLVHLKTIFWNRVCSGAIFKGEVPISRVPLERCIKKKEKKEKVFPYGLAVFKLFYQQPVWQYTILADKVSVTNLGDVCYYRVSQISWSSDCDSVWLHLIQPHARWYIWEPRGQITAIRWKILSWKKVTLSETEKVSGDNSFNMSSQCKAAAERARVSS